MFPAGYTGTGKSSAGRIVADLLGADFVDLDEEIERREVISITENFRPRGETYFRGAEHETLRRVCLRGGEVVALGGGAVCFERNGQLLGQSGTVALLAAPAHDIWARTGEDSGRPLLDGGGSGGGGEDG